MSTESLKVMDCDVAQLNLNKELYTNTSSYFIGILSPKSKKLLTQPEDERVGTSLSNLLAEMGNIDFFKMFSSRTKEALAKKLRFVARPADEILLVQGETEEPPQALYVIMSGVVTEHYRLNSETEISGKSAEAGNESPKAAQDQKVVKNLKTTEDETSGVNSKDVENQNLKDPNTSEEQALDKSPKLPETSETDANGKSRRTLSDQAKIWPEKLLRKGEFFGHVDMVYDRPPTVDAQTVGYCELLMLAKEDFGIVRDEMEALCTRAGRYLRTTEAICRFGWTEDEYRVLEIYSKLCTYAKNQHVYGGVVDRRPFWSYFVVSGECRVVRDLPEESVRKMNRPPTRSNEESANDHKMVTERIAFQEAKQGYYFGVGERFGGNHVIASSTLECLLIPRLLMVFKNKELLQAMAEDLTDSLPSDREALDAHSKLVAASKKKVEMFKELFKHKPHDRQ